MPADSDRLIASLQICPLLVSLLSIYGFTALPVVSTAFTWIGFSSKTFIYFKL